MNKQQSFIVGGTPITVDVVLRRDGFLFVLQDFVLKERTWQAMYVNNSGKVIYADLQS